MSITFTKDKETKNTVRFSCGSGEVSGSLYVQKDSELAANDELVIEVSEPVEA